MLAIGVKENEEQGSLWISQRQLSYSVMIDPEGEIYRKFGNGSVPYHVFIDEKSVIRHSQESFDKDSLVQLLKDHL